MEIESHIFTPSANKKQCKVCHKIYSECMRWVDLFVIEGPKERDFYGKSLKAKHITDLYTYELVSTIKDFEKNLEIVQIESTNTISYMLNNKGEIFHWGIYPGDEHIMDLFEIPILYKQISGILIVGIACGDSHILALESAMYLWSWGDNSHGQLGRKISSDSSKTEEGQWGLPARIPEVNLIVRISAGPNSSFAVNSKGILFAWGDNSGNKLGILKEDTTIKEPCIIDTCPWNSEVSHQKSYFKTEIIREIKVSGLSRTEVRFKQKENEDLESRISFLSKKVDFLEDELLSTGTKKLAKLWDKNLDLKEIIKLKENVISSNKKIDESVEAIEKKIKECEKKITENTSKIEQHEKVIMADLEAIKGHDIQIEEQINEIGKRNNQSNKDEISKIEANITKMITKRKKKHGKVVYFEMEIKKNQDEIEKCKTEKSTLFGRIVKKKSKIDGHLAIYREMESVKKKEISENFILQVNSRTFQEIRDLDTIRIAVSKASIDYLNMYIGAYSYPEEIIETSNKLLKSFGNHVKEKFKRSGFSYVGKTIIVWSVIMENIKLMIELNRLRSTISLKLLEETRMKLEDWELEDATIKQKLTNEIFREAKIDDSIAFNDLTTQANARKLKLSQK